MIGKIFIVCLIAYLAGSVNFAILFFKMTGRGDPRQSFSGNAGTTNVYRQAGIFWATVVFLLDIGRAVVVALLAVNFLKDVYSPWICLFLVLGNSFPCFHDFRGGKGVANYLGFTLIVAPWAALASALIWLAAYGVFRVTFVASFFMVATLAAGQVWILHFKPIPIIGAALTLLLILFNHRKNIANYSKSKNHQT